MMVTDFLILPSQWRNIGRRQMGGGVNAPEGLVEQGSLTRFAVF